MNLHPVVANRDYTFLSLNYSLCSRQPKPGKMISIFFFFGCWTLEPQACFFLFFFLENKSIYVYLHLIKLCFLVSMWSSDGWWRKALCSSRASISLSWEGMTVLQRCFFRCASANNIYCIVIYNVANWKHINLFDWTIVCLHL